MSTPSTKFTFMIEIVCEYVHAESRHTDIHFAANMALFSIGRVQTAVSLSVSGQVAAGCIMFATISTGILGFLTLITSLFTPSICNW